MVSQNFPSAIRTLLNDATHWLILDPAFADVQFPQKVSRSYLTRADRVGKNMVWIDEQRGMPQETQPLGGCLMRGLFDIFCYARAKSSQESEVKAAEDRSTNMRQQASDIIKAHYKTLTGAILMRPIGTYPLAEYNIDPCFFVKVLTVEVFYEI